MIITNSVKCNLCNEVIFSAHVHDYVTCSCGNISVDGGQDYLKRVGGLTNYTELSFSLDEEIYKGCAKAVEAAIESGRNNLGIANAVLRFLNENNVLKTGN